MAEAESTADALPVGARVSRNVVETVGKVRVVNGYHVDLTVERYRRNGGRGNRPRHMLAVVHQDDDTDAGPSEDGTDLRTWLRRYTVQIYVIESELKSAESFDELCELARADVEKIILLDTTRGNHAQNTVVDPPGSFDGEGDVGGVLVNFTVTYWARYDDPFRRN